MRKGDKGGTVDAWDCMIMGMVETAQYGYNIRCETASGAGVYMLSGAAGSDPTGGPQSCCPSTFHGRPGTLVVLDGEFSCTQAKAMMIERGGGIGYFKIDDGTAWACGSQDDTNDYECYSAQGPEKHFRWIPD